MPTQVSISKPRSDVLGFADDGLKIRLEILALSNYFHGAQHALVSLVLLAFQMQQVEICAVLVTCVSAAESSGGSSIATQYKKRCLFKVT